MRTYDVVHTTTYTYDDVVTDSLGLAHLLPRELAWQRVTDAQVRIDPEPDDTAQQVDCYGNTSTYFQVTRPHETLLVEGRCRVEVGVPWHDPDALAAPWETLRPLRDPHRPGAWVAAEHALASPQVPLLGPAREYAAASLRPGRPVAEAVTDLVHRLHADLDYDPTATTVTSTVQDTLETRAGVCQDFAHLALSCLRGHGLAARYVSGYLATEPPPGRERVVGADASHAWVEVWLGADAWLAVDPTNDQWVGERYVTVAWGRDYADVSPLKGVIFTEAERSTMSVSVDVAPVPLPGAGQPSG